MTRLGRNPFDKKVEKRVERPIAEEVAIEETITSDAELPPRLAAKKPLTTQEKVFRFLRVDLPAEGFILGLKAALLLRSVWD